MSSEKQRASEGGPCGRDDDALQDVLARYFDRLNAGEMVPQEEIREKHPEWADEILEQLETFREIGADDRRDSGLGTFGSYRIRGEVGRGGMGVVYEAIDENIDRRVALKVLPAGLKIDEKSVERFRREARIVGKLQHPNIVTVHATGVEDKTPYIVMEFVDGESLEKVLDRKRPELQEYTPGLQSRILTGIQKAFARRTTTVVWAPSERRPADDGEPGPGDSFPPIPTSLEEMDVSYCIRMATSFAAVSEGLQYAHSKGVVHRDLKPSNLILDAGGNLRILDFGLAQLEGQDSLTGSGEILGTPRYMSPEQARARNVVVDHRTDVYSVGATLYEVLTLRPPFQGKDAQDTLSQIIHRDPRPPRQLNPRVPRDLETVVLKCLRKNPADRYGTAEALAQDLRRFARGAPVEARPQSRGEKFARILWQNRRKLAVAAVVFCLLLGLAWLYQDRARQDRQTRVAQYEPKVRVAILKLSTEGVLTRQAGMFLSQINGYDFERVGLGVAYFGGDPVAEAVQNLKEAIATCPERPDAYYHLARALLHRGSEDKATEALECAIDRSFVPAMVLRASRLKIRGELEAAERLLERARQSGEGGWSETWLAADLAARERRWQDAVDAYQKLINLRDEAGREPYLGSSIEIYLGCGVARLELKDFDGARENFAAARALCFGAPEPDMFMGFAWREEGVEHEKRTEDIFKAIFKRSPSSHVAGRIAVFYSARCGQFDKALSWAERMEPGPTKEIWRAGCLAGMGEWEKVREVLEQVETKSAAPHLLLADAYRQAGELELAAEVAERGRRLAPGSAAPYVLLSTICREQGDREGSLQAAKKAVEVEPESPRSHFQLAVALWNQGMLEEAARSGRKAIDLARESGGTFFAGGMAQRELGVIYMFMGKSLEALDMFSESFEVSLQHGLFPRDYYYGNLLSILLRDDLPDLGRALERLVAALERAVALGPERNDLLHDHRPALILALLRSSRRDHWARALHHAEALLEDTGSADARALVLLAWARFLNGKGAAAARSLDRAFWLPEFDPTRQFFLKFFIKSDLLEFVRDELPTYGSIDRASVDRVQLVPEGATWRFFKGTEEPSEGLEWTTPGFDDSGWESGPSGFGYGDGDDATVLDDMERSYTTLYIRHSFPASDLDSYRRVLLSVRADDGFVAYFNGREIVRFNAGDEADVRHDARAPIATWEPLRPAGRWLETDLLEREVNVLAIVGLNCSTTSSDFSLLPVLEAEVEDAPEKARAFLEEFRAGAQGENVEGRLAYLEGRVLQREGKLDEAAARLAEAVARDTESPEACLALAECLLGAGKAREAQDALRQGVERDCPAYRDLWNLWFRVSAVDLGMSPEKLLADFPAEAVFGSGTVESDRADRRSARSQAYAADLFWLLRQLRETGAVRINCGGNEYTSEGGTVWGRDRFCIAGRPSTIVLEVAKTKDDPIYHTGRWYQRGSLLPPRYTIPLPPGRYRVTLHFAEAFSGNATPGARVFGVRLEGKSVLQSYDIFAAVGVATADRKEFPVTVEDAFLDVEFVHGVGHPKVFAIEIELER